MITTTANTGLKSRLLKGISWNLAGTLATQGSVLIANMIIANIIGKEQFGAFGIIQSTILTISGLAQMATGLTATRYVAQFRMFDKLRAGRILGLCSALSAIMAISATVTLLSASYWLASVTLKSPNLTYGFVLSAGFLFFSVLNGFQTGALSGLEAYYKLARTGVIQGCFHLAALAICTKMWGLNGALIGLSVSALLRWYIFQRLLYSEATAHGIFLNYRCMWLERSLIIKFALPAALSSFSTLPALWFANAILVRQPGGLEQMGLYSAANAFRCAVLFFPVLMGNVGLSLLSQQKGANDDKRFRKVYWANLGLTAVTTVCAVIVICGLGPWLLRLFGKDFAEGITVLRILLLSTIPESLAITTYQAIQTQDRMWLSFFSVALPRDLAILILSYYLAPRYGAAGLAGAYTISWTLALVMIVIIVKCCGITEKRTLAEI